MKIERYWFGNTWRQQSKVFLGWPGWGNHCSLFLTGRYLGGMLAEHYLKTEPKGRLRQKGVSFHTEMTFLSELCWRNVHTVSSRYRFCHAKTGQYMLYGLQKNWLKPGTLLGKHTQGSMFDENQFCRKGCCHQPPWEEAIQLLKTQISNMGCGNPS